MSGRGGAPAGWAALGAVALLGLGLLWLLLSGQSTEGPVPIAVLAAVEPAPAPRWAGASGYRMALLPAGTAQLGCTAGQGGRCADDERPARAVTRSRALWVGETEVTQALWERVLHVNPAGFAGCARCPVEGLSWTDAAAFADALSAFDGLPPCYRISGEEVAWPEGLACLGYRLPTEAEWEAAARAGGDQRFAGGDAALAVAWIEGNSAQRTHPVGQKRPNALGLVDMSGGVWEWVWDWYGPYPADGAPEVDPLGPATGQTRVRRGGAWLTSADFARVSARFYFTPETASDIVGLRLVRTAAPAEAAAL